jgi:hypothetical protein
MKKNSFNFINTLVPWQKPVFHCYQMKGTLWYWGL